MLTSKITVYRYQKPSKGNCVVLEFSNGFTKTFYTDSDGVAYVNHSSKGNATIYIDGKKFNKMNAPGRDIVYL